MFDNRVSRFWPALNNAKESLILSDMYVPDRIDAVTEYPQDFYQYVPGDWTQNLNAGTAALVAGPGGLLAITSVATASTQTSLQKAPSMMTMVKNLRSWLVSQVSVDSLLGAIVVGNMNATATPFTTASQTDGAFFTSAVTTGALSFTVAVGGVQSTVACGASLIAGAVPAANLNFYYDGAVYGNQAQYGRVIWECWGAGVTANVRGEILVPASGGIAAFPGATNTSLVMGVNPSTAAARIIYVDKIYYAQDEVNINATPPF